MPWGKVVLGEYEGVERPRHTLRMYKGAAGDIKIHFMSFICSFIWPVSPDLIKILLGSPAGEPRFRVMGKGSLVSVFALCL